jgi:hypothetical protein
VSALWATALMKRAVASLHLRRLCHPDLPRPFTDIRPVALSGQASRRIVARFRARVIGRK